MNYYHQDPLDFTLTRFLELMNSISAVNYYFAPKSNIELGLEKSMAEIKDFTAKIRNEKT